MNIFLAGAFRYFWYEEACASALESLGHSVTRFRWDPFFTWPGGKVEDYFVVRGPSTLAMNTTLIRRACRARPDLILVSAGFDIFSGDPLGGMKVTPRGFSYLTRILMDVADACSNGRIVLSLEGGYSVEGLTMSVTAVIKELSEATHATEDELRDMEASADTRQDAVIRAVMNQLNPFWKVY